MKENEKLKAQIELIEELIDIINERIENLNPNNLKHKIIRHELQLLIQLLITMKIIKKLKSLNHDTKQSIGKF